MSEASLIRTRMGLDCRYTASFDKQTNRWSVKVFEYQPHQVLKLWLVAPPSGGSSYPSHACYYKLPPEGGTTNIRLRDGSSKFLFLLASLASQCHHRIDLRRPPRWKIAGKQ